MNIAILFTSFGPYHHARIEAFSACLKKRGAKLCSFRFAEFSNQYPWDPCSPGDTEVSTLATKEPSSIFDSFKIAIRFYRHLTNRRVAVTFLPSYSPLPNLLCVLAAKLSGSRLVLMCDSWDITESKNRLIKTIKRIIFRLFDAALVAGTRHRAYAVSYGIPECKIFVKYDVIDVDFFARNAALVFKDIPSTEEDTLLGRFFLNVGRFVPKKNLELLLEAYALLITEQPDLDMALVLVGEGECLSLLQTLSKKLGIPWFDGAQNSSATFPKILHFPFQQISQTPRFFSRCDAFILPSFAEEWGLVVNEAMACSAPVIVSTGVGCALDLVIEGVTGFTFNPSDVVALKDHLAYIFMHPEAKAQMGAEGSILIRNWKPIHFAENANAAVDAALV